MSEPGSAYRGGDPFVFVSYSHEDSQTVLFEIQKMQSWGFNIWYDQGIEAGLEWREELAEAIVGCGLFVIFVSPRSVASDNCRRELAYAQEIGRPVLAIHLETTELTPGVQMTLNDRQALHRFKLPRQHYDDRLKQSLGAMVSPVVQHDEPAVRQTHLRRIVSAVIVAFIAIVFLVYLADEFEPDVVATQPVADREAAPAIAVLPFSNLGDTADYFSEGVTEEILNRMVRIPEVRVVSRQSSFAYRGSGLQLEELGNSLKADYILQGSIRREEEKVRVSVTLSDTATGTDIWSRSYDRELRDILNLQVEIARSAIMELVPNLGVRSVEISEIDPNAYDMYLLGWKYRRENRPKLARELFEGAIAIDPSYARGYVWLAGLQNNLIRVMDPDNFIGDAGVLSLLQKALEIDPGSLEARSFKASIMITHEHDLQGAIELLESMIGSHPNFESPYIFYERVLRHTMKNELADRVRLRRRNNAVSNATGRGPGVLYMNEGAYDKAANALLKLPLEPPDNNCWSGQACWMIALAMTKGDFLLAQELTDDLADGLEATRMQVALELFQGNREAAAPLIAYLEHEDPNFDLIEWWPYLWYPLHIVFTGNASATLDRLENPAPSSIVWILRLRQRVEWARQHATPVIRQAFSLLESDPRFQPLMKRYGLDDESIAGYIVNTEELLDETF